jgi:hypothetical protein
MIADFRRSKVSRPVVLGGHNTRRSKTIFAKLPIHFLADTYPSFSRLPYRLRQSFNPLIGSHHLQCWQILRKSTTWMNFETMYTRGFVIRVNFNPERSK